MKNKPLIERVVTVTGKSVKNPGNFLCRIGTPNSKLIEAAGGMPEDTAKVIGGGPMMGRTMVNIDSPVMKGTSGVLLISEKEAARKLVAEKLKYAGSGGISEEMAYDLVAGSLLGCIHQELVGVPKKLKVSTLFTNPDVTKPDQVRNIIKSGKLNFATVMEAQNIKMLNGKPLFADY